MQNAPARILLLLLLYSCCGKLRGAAARLACK
jgi:hypothetical protein